MFDWVTRAGPAITPATAASPVPTPNTSMNTRGTLWPSIATMCGWVSEAWMMSPMRVRAKQQQQHREDRDRGQKLEHLVGWIVGRERSECGEIQRRRHAIIHRALAPDHLHDFFDDKGKAEREQKLGDRTVAVHVAQAKALDQRADAADQHRRDDEGRPEADPLADLEAEEGAQHVEAGMGEI